jgi:hypothetical protein
MECDLERDFECDMERHRNRDTVREMDCAFSIAASIVLLLLLNLRAVERRVLFF